MDVVIGAPDHLAAVQPELGQYCALTNSAPVPFAGSAVADLQRAAAGASSLFLLGDLPTVTRQEDLYGHGSLREETHDLEIVPGVPTGRYDMSRLTGVDAIAVTRAYLARFCDHWQNGPRLPFRRTFTDGFSDQYPGFTPQAQSQFSRIPASLMEYHPAADSNVSGPYGPGAALRAAAGCFWECFGGGMGPDWMWNQGQAPTWKANPVRALYCGIFGSFLGEVHQPDCLMNVVASWGDTLFCVLNYYALFPWARFLAGAPIGEVARAGGTLTNLVGSPLVRLPQEVVDMVGLLGPLQAEIDAMKTDIAALKAGGAGGTVIANLSKVARDPGWTGSIWETTAPVVVSGVANALGMSVYQSIRFSPTEVRAPAFVGLTPGALYRLRCHFCEMGHNSAGQRLIDVTANGTIVISRIDAFAEAGGSFRALVKDLSAVADASGQLVIGARPFAGSPDQNAYLCAVELLGA
jgi:hypothetical protein